ncbi:MAG: DUF3105 domain-containing protein [Chloroflexi bacterium]|nr:DUF3105 domain-containing protein [Chloroflexota bacterium]
MQSGLIRDAVLLSSLLLAATLLWGCEEPTATPGQPQARTVGERFSVQGFQHIPEGQTFAGYNSVPPTSGPHWGAPAPWGIAPIPIPNERQVHNLEHGGVLIQYNTQDSALIKQLEDYVKNQRASPCWLLLAPYPTMTHTIALTGWGVMDTMDAYDESRLQAFADAYRDRGPEKVPCTS